MADLTVKHRVRAQRTHNRSGDQANTTVHSQEVAISEKILINSAHHKVRS